jgi:hypothetical protein
MRDATHPLLDTSSGIGTYVLSTGEMQLFTYIYENHTFHTSQNTRTLGLAM